MSGSVSSFTEAPPAQPIRTRGAIPDPLQQLLDKLESWALEAKRKALSHDPDERKVLLHTTDGLRRLKNDLERQWQIAASEGYTSSATLAEILEGGWREWKRITARPEL